MPVLPSAQDVPTVSPRVGRDPGIRNVSRLAEPSGIEALGQGIGQAVAKLKSAQDRITARQAALDRIRSTREFNEFAHRSFTQMSSEQDFSRPETTAAYGQALRSQSDALLGNYRGREEDRLQLAGQLEQAQADWASRAAGRSLEISERQVNETFGGMINELTSQARLTPEDAEAIIERGRQMISEEAAALRPAQEAAFDRMLTAGVYTGILDTFLSVGDTASARELLEDPLVQNRLGPEAQSTYFTKLITFDREVAKARLADVKGVPRDIFNQLTPDQQAQVVGAVPSDTSIKGVPANVFNAMTPSQQQRILFGAEDDVKGVPLSVFNSLSATERGAVLGRSPLVSISNESETALAKRLGQKDADRINELEDEASNAQRSLDEIARMRAALKSGKFKTGVLSGQRVFLARLADFMNASPDTRKIVGDAATADTLDAAANRLAVEHAKSLSRITKLGLQFIRNSLPDLTRTPEGNEILLEVMLRVAERQIVLATMAEDWIQRYDTLRPKEQTTYFQAVRDLEDEDPVVNDELKRRIEEGSRNAPKSLRDVFSASGEEEPQLPRVSTQEEFDALAPGTEFIDGRTGRRGTKVR